MVCIYLLDSKQYSRVRIWPAEGLGVIDINSNTIIVARFLE